MGKLSVGLWYNDIKTMKWIKGPSEACKKMFPKTLTKDQWEKYGTLKQENKKADSYELMGVGDPHLRKQLDDIAGE